MQSRSSVKINLAASWLDQGIGLLIGIVLMPYVLHTLGDETYGIWLLINSFAGYQCFFYLGFGDTVCRFVAKYHAQRDWDRMNQVVSVIFFSYVGMGVLAFLVAVGVACWAPSLHDWGGESPAEIQLVILVLGLSAFLAMSTTVFGGVLVGIQRFDIERGFNLLSGVVRLVLTLVFLQQEWALLTLSLVFLVVTLTEHIGHVIFAFRKVPTLRIGFRGLRWSTTRELFSFSAFEFLNSVSRQCLEVTDTVIIGIVLGAKATVPYYIAMRLCKFIRLPIEQIGQVFMPRAGELHANSERTELRSLVTKGVGMSFLLTMGFFIGTGFFGTTLIETWVGPGYGESHLLLLVLLGTQVIATPLAVFRSVLFGMGHVRAQSLMNLAKAIANIGLSILLIKPFGLMGVALGTAIPVLVVELGMLLPFAVRKVQLELGRLIRDALGPQLVALAALLGYSLVVADNVELHANWFFLIAVALGGGVVLALGWLAHAQAEKHWRGAKTLTPNS